MSKICALVIDDDVCIREQIEDRLMVLGQSCDLAENMQEAEELLGKNKYDYVVLDMEIPSRYGSIARINNGKLLLLNIRKKYSHTELPIIVITGHGLSGIELCSQVFRNGANDFVAKPLKDEEYELETAVSNCLKNKDSRVNTWLSRKSDKRFICWTVTTKNGGSLQFESLESSIINKVLEVVYMHQDEAIIPHAAFMDGCGWAEDMYFRKTAKGDYSAKRGPIKNHIFRIRKSLKVEMKVEKQGIAITKP